MKCVKKGHIWSKCVELKEKVDDGPTFTYVWGVPAQSPTDTHDLRVYLTSKWNGETIRYVEKRKRGTYKSHRLLQFVLCVVG